MRCAAACASSQSANHGFRGSSGPCRYVPTTRPGPAALVAARAVVAEARDDPAERLRAVVQDRPARRGSRTRRACAAPRLELALEQHVADHPPLAGDRVQRQGGRRRAAPTRSGRGSSARAAGSRRRPRARRRRPRPPRRAPALRRCPARSGPARDPGRRRCRGGRARRAAGSRRARSARPRARGRARPRAARARPCSRGRRRCSGSPGTGDRRGSSRGALPVLADVPAPGDDLPQREHRRVGGEDDELAAGTGQRQAAIERLARGRERPPAGLRACPRTCSAAPARRRGRPRRRAVRGPPAAARSRRPRSTRRRGRRRSRR